MRHTQAKRARGLYAALLQAAMLFTWLGLCLTDASAQGSLKVIRDPRVDELVNRHIALNKRLEGVADGYRVQVFFDSGAESKKRATEARSAFLEHFPDIPVYLVFQEPFYKVRAGDFRRRLEADGLLQELLPYFPNAFTVIDRIAFPRLDP